MSDTSVASSVTRDNLFSGANPPVKRGTRTIGASQTVTRGTALGKVTIAAGTASAEGTGDGAITFALAAGGPAKLGDWTAVCVAEAANSGTFHLFDPDGILVGILTVAVAFTGGGISVTIADGDNDWDIDDVVTLPVEAGAGTCAVLDIASNDGSQKVDSIALEAVTTGVGASAEIAVGLTGSYQTQQITLGGSTTVADIEADARTKGIFFDTTYSGNNAVGG